VKGDPGVVGQRFLEHACTPRPRVANRLQHGGRREHIGWHMVGGHATPKPRTKQLVTFLSLTLQHFTLAGRSFTLSSHRLRYSASNTRASERDTESRPTSSRTSRSWRAARYDGQSSGDGKSSSKTLKGIKPATSSTDLHLGAVYSNLLYAGRFACQRALRHGKSVGGRESRKPNRQPDGHCARLAVTKSLNGLGSSLGREISAALGRPPFRTSSWQLPRL